MTTLAENLAEQASASPVSVSYADIPYVPRRWAVPGIAAYGEVTVHAASGESAKGLTWCAFAARMVLGLPMPGEDREMRHEPAQVLWVPSGTEDDQLADLAWRFRAAIVAAAGEFGLDAERALAAGLPLIRDFAETAEDGAPFTLPADLGKLVSEVARCEESGPPVGLVIIDPLTAMLSQGANIASVQGARAVMGAAARAARAADVALVIIHHVTSSGKIAGSPAVTDSVRLAVTTRKDPKRDGVLVLARYKSNISKRDDLRMAVVMDEPDTHVVFLDGSEPASTAAGTAAQGNATLRDRIAAVPPHQGTLRDRVRAAAGMRDGWVVTRRRISDGTVSAPEHVGRAWPGADEARRAACADAGTGLAWRPVDGRPGMEVAGLADSSGQGNHVSYVVRPA